MTATAHLSFGDDPSGLEDLEIVSNTPLAVAMPYDGPTDAKYGLLAVALADHFGNRSIDRLRKKYEAAWRERDTPRPAYQQLVLDFTGDAKQSVKQAARRAYELRNKPGAIGPFAAGAAMLRLAMSFRVAVFAVRNAFHFEAAAISRLILEQIAWAYRIHEINDDSIFRMAPASTIGQFRQLFDDAGRLYGELSQAGHIHPELTARYIEFSNTGDPSILLSSPRSMGSDTIVLLRLVDMYAATLEVIFADQHSRLEHSQRRGDGLLGLRPDRPCLRALNDFKDRWAALQ